MGQAGTGTVILELGGQLRKADMPVIVDRLAGIGCRHGNREEIALFLDNAAVRGEVAWFFVDHDGASASVEADIAGSLAAFTIVLKVRGATRIITKPGAGPAWSECLSMAGGFRPVAVLSELQGRSSEELRQLVARLELAERPVPPLRIDDADAAAGGPVRLG